MLTIKTVRTKPTLSRESASVAISKAKETPATEVAAHMSFDSIRYAQVWEDSRLLNWALELEPHDHVLSISSAGCNVLSLLLKEPASIISVDLNPIQNAIVALKLYAIESLGHQEFIELIGLAPSNRLSEIVQGLPASRWNVFTQHWKTMLEDLQRGLPRSGRLEQFFIHFAEQHFAQIPNFAAWRACFEWPQLAEQKRLLPMLENAEFAKIFAENFGQAMLEKGRDPAQFRYVERADIGAEFYRRFMRFLREQSLFGNAYSHFFMFGCPIRNDLGPDSIQQDNFPILRRNAHKVRLQTATIEEVLADPQTPMISKANLSNIFEYMSEDNMIQLLLALGEKMPKGGRIAFWNLLVDRSLPQQLRHHFRLLPIPKDVREADRVWFYQNFNVLERLA